jgi:5-methylcytosine-specific restriction endonuclease McrA
MQKIILRKEAIELGLKKYFTGNTCSRGHLSERTVYDKHCILCKRIRSKKHYDKFGPYKQDIKMHIWGLLRHIKYQRKSENASKLEFNREDFFTWFKKNYNGKCYYCDISLEKYEKAKIYLKVKVPGFRFGIDRKNSNGSYNLDNIAVCCSICNSAKSFVFEADEFKEIARKYIKKLYE